MNKILICGANGKMGQTVSKIAFESNICEVVAGFDKNPNKMNKFPVYDDLSRIFEKPDVLIDFSNSSSLEEIIRYSIDKKIPAVICTTGLSNLQHKKIEEASKKVSFFLSSNMSLGINLLIELVKSACKILGENFDIEIIEKHHNQKLDSPSGTTYAISDAISKTFSKDINLVYGRKSTNSKRNKNEIGIHSIRGGSIVGEHTVLFSGNDEIIEIKHCASSKEIFAVGAIRAALFLIEKPPKLYNMNDLIDSFK
ncbi:MAG: 4-hydroxy-tetrahydrodipicolinate reductase [Clostridiales bacterium]|nr:4-hydroxy-tetrahydrodipicolinate reductase [Clostridiales bacterium]